MVSNYIWLLKEVKHFEVDKLMVLIFYSQISSKTEEITRRETVIKDKDEQMVKLKTDLEQMEQELKQAQNQLVMKDEQLIHVQDTMLKVKIT